MRCDDLNRWLDEGAPESDSAAARAHAAGCAECAAAIEAFDALERALASPAPAPPNAATFTARVMERVERPAPAPAPVASKPAPVPWWIAMISEPAFAVALVAALLLLTTPAALRLQAGRSLVLPLTVASDTFGAQFAQAMRAWFAPLAFATNLSPIEQLYVSVGLVPFMIWGGIWLYRSVERTLRAAPARRG
jgi:anti-sigma factor RsiW